MKYTILILSLALCTGCNRNAITEHESNADTLLNAEGYVFIKDSTSHISVYKKCKVSFEEYRCDTTEFQRMSPLKLNRKIFTDITMEKFGCDYTSEDVKSIAEKDFENLEYEIEQNRGQPFANYYEIFSISCGSSCQRNIMIDLRNGNITEAPQSAWGIVCKKYSNLVVLNISEKEINSYIELNTVRKEYELWIYPYCLNGKNVFVRL